MRAVAMWLRGTWALVCGFTQIALAGIELALALNVRRFVSWKSGARENYIAWFVEKWTRRIWKAAERNLGLKTSWEKLGHSQLNEPCIVIAPHRGMLDGFLLTGHVLPALGVKRFTAIAKQEIKKLPVIGWVAELIGCVFIDRSAGDSAVAAVEKWVAGDSIKNLGHADAEPLGIIVFPEGTRRSAEGAQESRYAHLSNPKPRGFTALHDALRDWPVLVVCFSYGHVSGARGLKSAVELAGRRLKIATWVVRLPDLAGAAAQEWLKRVWHEMDMRIEEWK